MPQRTAGPHERRVLVSGAEKTFERRLSNHGEKSLSLILDLLAQKQAVTRSFAMSSEESKLEAQFGKAAHTNAHKGAAQKTDELDYGNNIEPFRGARFLCGCRGWVAAGVEAHLGREVDFLTGEGKLVNADTGKSREQLVQEALERKRKEKAERKSRVRYSKVERLYGKKPVGNETSPQRKSFFSRY